VSLTFNAVTHRYRMDKKHVSGVTTILGKAIPKDGLKFWAANEVAQYVADKPDEVATLREMGGTKLYNVLKRVPFDKRDDAGKRGTDIHEVAEQIVHGETVEVPESLVPYVDDFARFLDTWQVEPIITEKSVGHRGLWYAGRPDFIGRVGGIFGGAITCLDWKSSKGVYAETALQTAAYARAEFWVPDDDPDDERAMPEVERLGVVHLTPEGTKVYDLGDPDEHFKLFRHIKYVADRLPALDDLVKVPAPDPVMLEVVA
jgi:hypothetical protein